MAFPFPWTEYNFLTALILVLGIHSCSGKSPGGPSNGDTMNNNKQNGNKRKKLGPPLRMKLEDLERGERVYEFNGNYAISDA